MAKSNTALPPGLLVSWYGDDFTGSAAVMEVLSFAGLDSVLFLDRPTPEQLKRFEGVRGIGIAGTARSQSPAWMDRNLPPVFEFLKSLKAPICHYKVCSTLDSSSETGSIGRAIDIAQPILNSDWIPVLLAAPAIRRYQCFGNLFAAAPGGVFRLDRHPVMARHPVTPMGEADVALHIMAQTDREVGLVDLEMLQREAPPDNLAAPQGAVLALDTLDDNHLMRVGELIWQHRGDGLFCVGSQGVEYALVAQWRAHGLLAESPPPPGAGPGDGLVVVSGSVSEITGRQIQWAVENGFAPVPCDASRLIAAPAARDAEINHVVTAAVEAAGRGTDPLIFTARGPDDPAVARYRRATEAAHLDADTANHQVGMALGNILDLVLRQSGIRRAVIAGGDTSGQATQQLGIFALTALAPTVPGAALFQAHSDVAEYDGLQLALKGGQMGTADYFGWIRNGGGAEKSRRRNS